MLLFEYLFYPFFRPIVNLLLLIFWLPMIFGAKDRRLAASVQAILHLAVVGGFICLIQAGIIRWSVWKVQEHISLLVLQLTHFYLTFIYIVKSKSLSRDYVLMATFALLGVTMPLSPMATPLLNFITILHWVALAIYMPKYKSKILLHGFINFVLAAVLIFYLAKTQPEKHLPQLFSYNADKYVSIFFIQFGYLVYIFWSLRAKEKQINKR